MTVLLLTAVHARATLFFLRRTLRDRTAHGAAMLGVADVHLADRRGHACARAALIVVSGVEHADVRTHERAVDLAGYDAEGDGEHKETAE